jgi:phosphopantothenoylcysteine decarboxylase/phosphopantothenate--cysteine ligase
MRKVAVFVTGSIAAYKACELVRLLVSNGDEVRVAMTPAACEFVSPLTFATLSRNPVAVDRSAEPQEWVPGHVSLAEWAEFAVVAPATANTIAKMRCGIADNFVLSALLATRAKKIVAPAMNDGMWEAAATRENVAALAAQGVAFVGPGDGELACGSSGRGRMAAPAEIFEAIG